ncbi:MAG: hypothetical protein JRK26_13735 [Deltaproteobacteria bacterium]|nr:hypothetical protein [Deltaproteobacteria bacterium]
MNLMAILKSAASQLNYDPIMWAKMSCERKIVVFPWSIEAEETIIASCLRGHAKRMVEILTPGDFQLPAHRRIFDTIRSLVNEGNQVDLVEIAIRLKNHGCLGKIGGLCLLERFFDLQVPVASDVYHDAKRLKLLAMLRKHILYGFRVKVENSSNELV